ncbi:hypothetical protein BGX26_006673 [Mortierella sp. AD094]|nr:hypothetical protein BGX26_006673 [Mortierella sp. AD094]
MYKKLEEEGNLSLGDREAFSVGYITMIGISNPPNPERYPQLGENDRSYFRVTIGENNDSEEKAKAQQFRNSEWGPESVDTMLREFRDFPCALGGTMKELFDATPKNLISKVFLEEIRTDR